MLHEPEDGVEEAHGQAEERAALERRLVVHIGPHKTGTTYIQQVLARDDLHLLAASRLLYPTTGRGPGPGHHRLAMDAGRHSNGDAALRETWNRLRDEFDGSGASLCLLSSENFCVLETRQVQVLSEMASEAGFCVEVLIGIRRADRLLCSLWQEMVKSGDTRGLSQVTYSLLQDVRLHVDRLAAMWASVFGPGKISAFVVPESHAPRDALMATLGKHLRNEALCELKPLSREKANQSLSSLGTELLRRANSTPQAKSRPYLMYEIIGPSLEAAQSGGFLRQDKIRLSAADADVVAKATHGWSERLTSVIGDRLTGSLDQAEMPTLESSSAYVSEYRELFDLRSISPENLVAIFANALASARNSISHQI